MKEILLALNCAHENGIVHRDVKPSNVLVDTSGRARLTDFGIARGVTVGGVADAAPVGTAEYMSPEQIMTPAGIDHRADVYSAGVMFFEMLTGRLPFTGESADAIKLHHIGTPPPNPRDVSRGVSRGLAAIVLKSLEKNPDKRFQGCFEFAKAIEAYEQRFRRYLLMGAGTVVVLSLGVAYLVWIQPPPPPDQREAARTLVDSTVSNYSALCNQADRWRQKLGVRELVMRQGEAAMMEKWTQETSSINEAMARLTGDIGNNLSDLAKLAPDAVEAALQQPTAEAKRRRALRLTADGVNSFLVSGGPPTLEMLKRSCDQ
jgi:serine/threonine protein kinase